MCETVEVLIVDLVAKEHIVECLEGRVNNHVFQGFHFHGLDSLLDRMEGARLLLAMRVQPNLSMARQPTSLTPLDVLQAVCHVQFQLVFCNRVVAAL